MQFGSGYLESVRLRRDRGKATSGKAPPTIKYPMKTLYNDSMVRVKEYIKVIRTYYIRNTVSLEPGRGGVPEAA
jgi:hypothetical protein